MQGHLFLFVLIFIIHLKEYESTRSHILPGIFNPLSIIRKADRRKNSKLSIVPINNSRFQFLKDLQRDADFWSRSFVIYSSYKFFQLNIGFHKAKQAVTKPISTFFDRIRIIRINNQRNSSSNINVLALEDVWDKIHDINSERMMKLCLDMRGFYLKSGQFLGTRHDFMPPQYTSKLSQLHDNVPPLNSSIVKSILEKELEGEIDDYFSKLDLDNPVGSASIAQVHMGTWKKTGEKVAVKIQYPTAERVMTRDLKNIRFLAEFLQRTELKFDILSAIKELQKQISNEFDFASEAKNMDFMRISLKKHVPQVKVPQSVWVGKSVLVMTYIEGINLCRLAEFKHTRGVPRLPLWIRQRFGKKLLNTLAKAWGHQIFYLNMFQADPHPGNINIDDKGAIGLLDWGQVKKLSAKTVEKFALMILALNSNDNNKIVKNFGDLGVVLANYKDINNVVAIARTMLDTKKVPGYIIDPFNPGSTLKINSVVKMPPDLYFLIRTVQLMRGIAFGFEIDFSLAESWAPYARRYLNHT